MPQLEGEILEEGQTILLRHNFERIVEERISELIVEQVVDVPMPEVLKEYVEVMKMVPQTRSVGQNIELLVPQIVEELVVDISQERRAQLEAYRLTAGR